MFLPREPPRGAEIMAAPPSSSQSPPEHRSTMKPRSRVPWPNHRLLKCVRLDTTEPGTSPPPPPLHRRTPPDPTAQVEEPVNNDTDDLPWNLRTRRSTPASAVKSQTPSQTPLTAARRRRPRFALSLTKEEIDEDVYAFTGRLPSRRPRKRPRFVQKQMDVRPRNPKLQIISSRIYLVFFADDVSWRFHVGGDGGDVPGLGSSSSASALRSEVGYEEFRTFIPFSFFFPRSQVHFSCKSREILKISSPHQAA